MPSARRPGDDLPRARRAAGSKPVVGSSRKSSSGSPTRPGRRRAGGAGRRRGPGPGAGRVARARRGRSSRRPAAARVVGGVEAQASRTVRSASGRVSCSTIPIARGARSPRRGRAPRTATSPAVGSRKPSRISMMRGLARAVGAEQREDLAAARRRGRRRARPPRRRRPCAGRGPRRRPARGAAGAASRGGFGGVGDHAVPARRTTRRRRRRQGRSCASTRGWSRIHPCADAAHVGQPYVVAMTAPRRPPPRACGCSGCSRSWWWSWSVGGSATSDGPALDGRGLPCSLALIGVLRGLVLAHAVGRDARAPADRRAGAGRRTASRALAGPAARRRRLSRASTSCVVVAAACGWTAAPAHGRQRPDARGR